jgi:hypothetical protein
MAADRNEPYVGFQEDGSISSAEDSPRAFILAVYMPRVVTDEPMHARAEISMGRVHDETVAVR